MRAQNVKLCYVIDSVLPEHSLYRSSISRVFLGRLVEESRLLRDGLGHGTAVLISQFNRIGGL